MKNFRRLICILISALLLVSCFSFAVNAADNSSRVKAFINGDAAGVFEIDSDTFALSFYVDAPDSIVDGQCRLLYSDNLKIEGWEFPIVDPSVIDNIDSSNGVSLFNFSSARRPYDFSGGKILVSAAFSVTDNGAEDAEVNLCFEELDSAQNNYFSNGEEVVGGVSFSAALGDAPSGQTDDSSDEGFTVESYANGKRLASNVVDSESIAVTFKLKVPENIVDGQFSINYDSRVLELYKWDFPVIDGSVVDNINAYPNSALFNFSYTKSYDFTSPETLVTAYFNVMPEAKGRTEVKLIIDVLDSAETEYFGNGAATPQGIEVLNAVTSDIKISDDGDSGLLNISLNNRTVKSHTVSGEVFSVSLFIKAPELLTDGQVELLYDSSKLRLLDWEFPVLGDNVIDNLRSSENKAMFNFSSVVRKFDFTSYGELVKARFEVINNFKSSDIEFNIVELDSEKTMYFDNSSAAASGTSVLNSAYVQVSGYDTTIEPTEDTTATYEDTEAPTSPSESPESTEETLYTEEPQQDTSSTEPSEQEETQPQTETAAESIDFKYIVDAGGNAVITGYTGKAVDVVIPEKLNGYPVASIGSFAFFGNSDIKSVKLPDSVAIIGENAFSGCEALNTVYLGSGVTTIGYNAFTDCPSLSAVYFNGTRSQWSKISISSGNESLAKITVTPSSDVQPTRSAISGNTAPARTRSISVNVSSKTLYVKQSFRLKAKASDGAVIRFTSSNTKAASVSQTGKVTAKKRGTATITVSSGNVKKTVKIKVINPKLNKTKKTLKQGKAFKIKIKGLVGKAKFKSSNKSVAKVSKKGKLTALKKGRASITVTANGVKLKLKIKVK